MERRSALSRWFVSGVLALSAMAGAALATPVSLDQEALSHPETIAAWLDANAKVAEQSTAQRYLVMARAAQKQGRWSRAAMAFGESALFFPTPAALTGYADNRLRLLADVRRRENDGSQTVADLGHAHALYRSALAAEEHLKMLDPGALAQLRSDEACLTKYLQTKSPPPINAARACRPLGLYNKARKK